ncbi:MAG: BrnT family toxin [Chloroflexi bacterium]|nr:BrnT family toxin [Chloroflexota bacterium]
MSPRFEWDPEKAESNRRKHGVAFEEATSVFDDDAVAADFDFWHSDVEERHVGIGASRMGRVIVVAFAERGDTIRIISARPAMPQERLEYERQARRRGF